MRTESGLSPDPSSIGSRVRSSKLKVTPSRSMDYPDSSLNPTIAVENPQALVPRNTSPTEGERYPPIGPPSVIGTEEVAICRKRYNLPDDVAIQVPGPDARRGRSFRPLMEIGPRSLPLCISQAFRPSGS
ncbi:hypothetical protein Bca4012_010503 [Brassica carinata]